MLKVVIALMVVLATISFTVVCLYYNRYKFRFPFKDTIGEVGLPVVSFEQNGKSFNFIIDSGADNSILNSSSLAEFDYINLKGNRPVYGIDGNPMETSFVGIKLSSQNHQFAEAFQVLNIPGLGNIEQAHNMKIVGLIGSSFLRRYGFLIDFKQLKAYTHGKENKVTNS